MQRLSISVIIGVVSLFLLMSPAFAGSFSLSWGNDQPDKSEYRVVTSKSNGPPAHAQAYGYRSKHQYQYFPSCSVYHDPTRGLYFYLSGSDWNVAAALPNDLRIKLGSFVSIDMDTDKPYIYNAQHKKQYPPGQNKKEKKWSKK